MALLQQGKSAQKMLTFRVYPDQMKLIEAARKAHPEGFRGVSHFAREALLDWAHLTVSKMGKGRAA